MRQTRKTNPKANFRHPAKRDALCRLSLGLERRSRIRRAAPVTAVVTHVRGADAIPGRIDLLSFVPQNNAAVLIFAKAELACTSWRIARNRVLAACLVWPKEPFVGCGPSPWVVPGESEAAAGAADSRL
ncbi:hypothetical protein [Rhizobium sp. R339]|uniref:hypothetical protein n=1 Tax=Rhizobium sp. R339 TaxID=1764273 RepID=UPI001FD8A561|nr:hypothetical protein [Rhizobium sp. R339]